MVRVIPFSLLILCCTFLSAQEQKAGTPNQPIEKLQFMAGHWIGEQQGRTTEEIWMPPKGGLMVGSNRVTSKASKASFEHVRIEQKDDKLIFFASPGGGGITEFVMKEIDDSHVVFENLAHDFPHRIIYRREGETLIAGIEGTVRGEEKSIEWRWKKYEPQQERNINKENSMFKGLRTVVYKVDDIAKAKKWYSNILGIEPYFDEPFYVGFNVGGYELGLDPDMKSVTRGNNQPAYWGVDDCKAAIAMLLEKGAVKDTEPQEVGEGIIVATVRDPFGNIFGVIQNPHFKFDPTK